MKAPTTVQVITAIARREIMMATRRRLVKLLFLGNLIPPIVMAVILVVNMIAKGLGADLDFAPLAKLLDIQTAPVLFLALAIGTPVVARDRSEDVASLLFTSGTTGDPKGVVLTHANFTALLASLHGTFRVDERDRFLSVLPLFHTFEFSCGLLMPASAGAPSASKRPPTRRYALERFRCVRTSSG